MHELVVAPASSLKVPAIGLQELNQLTTLIVCIIHTAQLAMLGHRSKNVAFDAFLCATAPVVLTTFNEGRKTGV